MRRNARQRVTACLLALLAQSGVIALFVHSRAPPGAHVDDPERLIFLQLVQPPLVRSPSPSSRPAGRSVIPAAVPVTQVDRVAIDNPEPQPESALPLDPAPGVDWYGLMKDAARSAAEREAERELHGQPGDSKPQVLVIPERPHQAGDTEQFDDGSVLTWVNERCYWVRNPHESGPRKICKTPTLAERRAEAKRIEREKAMKPGYLSRPLPLPKSPAH
jgi:hypothetical protein